MGYGDLAEFSVLDTRQYRSDPPCGRGEQPRCELALDPATTMTGPAQEQWLLDGLDASGATWNVLAQQVMMGELDHKIYYDGNTVYWQDAWDGFPAARARILDHVATHDIRNPVVITGDWHSTFVNDLKVDFKDPASPVVATEFVGTSISSNGDAIVYGPVLRADGPGQSTHPVLRRRSTGLRPLHADARHVDHRSPDGVDGVHERRARVHVRIVRRRGRGAGGDAGLVPQ